MNLTASDIDTITMYRFEPVRGSEDYRCGMQRVRRQLKTVSSIKMMLQSNDIARGICESFKTKR